MKSLFLALALIGFGAEAQIQFVDVHGTAYWMRSGEAGVVLVLGPAVQKIRKTVKADANSAIKCEQDYCVIGQMDRGGRLNARAGAFAGESLFQKLLKDKAETEDKPYGDWFVINKSKAYALVNQCEGHSKLTEVNIEGIGAEQLFNYLSVPAQPAERHSETMKVSENQEFVCYENLQYDPADMRDGRLLGKNYSYKEYRCQFNFTREGQPVRVTDCHINGGSLSAGGGK